MTPESAYNRKRITRYQLFLHNIKYSVVRFHRKRYSKIIYFFVFQLALLLVLTLNYKNVLLTLHKFEEYLDLNPKKGFATLVFVLILSSIPPIPGFGTISLFCGYYYRFPDGLLPVYLGMVFGSFTAFKASQAFIRPSAIVESFVNKYKKIYLVMKIVEKKSYRFMILVRLSPYPFSVMNVMFGISQISNLKYLVGLLGTAPKLLLYVYFGAQIDSFSGENNNHQKLNYSTMKLKILVFGCSLSVGVAVTYYIYLTVKRIVDKESVVIGSAEESGQSIVDAHNRGSLELKTL